MTLPCKSLVAQGQESWALHETMKPFLNPRKAPWVIPPLRCPASLRTKHRSEGQKGHLELP